MKLARRITPRQAKWAGLIGTIALLSLFVLSMRVQLGCSLANQPMRFVGIEMEFGRMTIGSNRYNNQPFVWDPECWWNDTRSWRVEMLPKVRWVDKNLWERRYVLIPLWLPLLLIAAPTAYVWRTDRPSKSWRCAKCRYDLRGLEGDVCPECGKPTGREA